MQNAPSVSYPVGRFAWAGWCLGAATLAVLCLHTAAGFTLSTSPARVWLGLAVSAVLLAWAGWVWWRSPCGWLTWSAGGDHLAPPGTDDGAGWWWAGQEGALGEPLQRVTPLWVTAHWALLHLQGAAPLPRWAWVQAAAAPSRWLALRRALLRHGG